MSDIKVGDLVYVAIPTPCCGSTKYLGFTFRIERIKLYDAHCTVCKKLFGYTVLAEGNNCCDALFMLRKVPPLSELEETLIKEELPA